MAGYQLSEYGRKVTWKTWQFLTSNNTLPSDTDAYKTLGPQISWSKDITLGDIEDACSYTGRTLAHYAVEQLKMKEFAKAWVD